MVLSKCDEDSTFRPHQVLVAIPALNEATHIADCLHSLIKGDGFMKTVTIVVADGGSTDGTQNIVRQIAEQHADLQLAENPARLQSAGINMVVAQHTKSSHVLLVRCDAHSIYPTNYVRDIVQAFERHPAAASITTVMDAEGATCFQRAVASIVDTPLGSGGSAHRGGSQSGWVDHGHHAGFRLDWFRRIDGYDASFSHNEDAEYDHRLGLAGGKIWLESTIRHQYQVRPTAHRLLRQYWTYGRGRAKTVFKHQMRPRIRQLIPVINMMLIGVSLLLAPFWTPMIIWPLLYACILLIASALTTLKLRSFCGIWAGPVLGIIHNAWAAGFIWEMVRLKTMRLQK